MDPCKGVKEEENFLFLNERQNSDLSFTKDFSRRDIPLLYAYWRHVNTAFSSCTRAWNVLEMQRKISSKSLLNEVLKREIVVLNPSFSCFNSSNLPFLFYEKMNEVACRRWNPDEIIFVTKLSVTIKKLQIITFQFVELYAKKDCEERRCRWHSMKK